MKSNMEVSEPLSHLPLDFSVTMMNLKMKQEQNNNNPVLQFHENNSSTSAFKVVTPRGKTDGKKMFFFVCWIGEVWILWDFAFKIFLCWIVIDFLLIFEFIT